MTPALAALPDLRERLYAAIGILENCAHLHLNAQQGCPNGQPCRRFLLNSSKAVLIQPLHCQIGPVSNVGILRAQSGTIGKYHSVRHD